MNANRSYSRQQVDDLLAHITRENNKALIRIRGIEDYKARDITIIEQECTKAVRKHLRIIPGIHIIKLKENFIKTLRDPFTNEIITELDGSIVIKNTITQKLILIIVEAKHHATATEISSKLSQLPKIQSFIDEAKKYYAASEQYELTKANVKKIQKKMKSLRRQLRNNASNVDRIQQEIRRQEEQFCRLDLEKERLDSDLDLVIEENGWHEDFVKTLQVHNLRFDKFTLFFGAPQWDNESDKTLLLNQKIGVIQISGNRYEIRPKTLSA